MTDMNAVNWFEIPVTNMDRASNFYNNVLQTEVQINQMGPMTMGWFPWKEGAPGSAGSLVMGEGCVPSKTGSQVYFSCGEDLQPTLDRVAEYGGSVMMPKTSIGEFGFIARFEDTEGNVVALHSTN